MSKTFLAPPFGDLKLFWPTPLFAQRPPHQSNYEHSLTIKLFAQNGFAQKKIYPYRTHCQFLYPTRVPNLVPVPTILVLRYPYPYPYPGTHIRTRTRTHEVAYPYSYPYPYPKLVPVRVPGYQCLYFSLCRTKNEIKFCINCILRKKNCA